MRVLGAARVEQRSAAAAGAGRRASAEGRAATEERGKGRVKVEEEKKKGKKKNGDAARVGPTAPQFAYDDSHFHLGQPGPLARHNPFPPSLFISAGNQERTSKELRLEARRPLCCPKDDTNTTIQVLVRSSVCVFVRSCVCDVWERES